MTLHREPQSCTLDIELSHWCAQNCDDLATVLAWLVLGHVLHVERILSSQGSEHVDPPEVTPELINTAVQALSQSGIDHRDGWLFQMVSWLAAKEEYPEAQIKAPQPRMSEPGFDGIVLEVAASTIQSLVVFEDKATLRPRATVLEVFEQLKQLESGARDTELVAEVSTLLKQVQNIDAATVVSEAAWLTRKRFRVSVATNKNSLPPAVHVFKGYDKAVSGARNRRLANLLLHEDMRSFFGQLSERIIAKLKEMRCDVR